MGNMEPVKTEIKRDAEGKILPGSGPLNPAGRPKGQTLKEHIRQRFLEMTPEEKDAFIAKLDPIDVFKMAEGNPHTTTDLTSGDKPLQTVLVQFIDKQEDAKDNTDSV